MTLWAQQCAEEFSCQAAPVPVSQLPILFAERKHATSAIDLPLERLPTLQSGLPSTQEEWLDVLQSRLPEVQKKAKQLGKIVSQTSKRWHNYCIGRAGKDLLCLGEEV